MAVSIRRATSDDAAAVADVFIRARRHNEPAIPPLAYPDDDVHRHFREVVLARGDVWVAIDDDSTDIVALLALDGVDVDHLYCAPGRTGRGIGADLINLAKSERPAGLELWAFLSNVGACRFYERHGFVEQFRTDGRDNVEKAPDVRYAWLP